MKSLSYPYVVSGRGRAGSAPQSTLRNPNQGDAWAGGYRGSEGHMPALPLDTQPHWSWSNPLNLLPILLLLLTIYAVAGTFL